MATLPASDAKSNWFGTIVTIALTLVLAYQLAHWTWVFVAPAPVAVVSEADGPVDLAAIARLFGGSAPSGPASLSMASLSIRGSAKSG
jgi:hypothetical protein